MQKLLQRTIERSTGTRQVDQVASPDLVTHCFKCGGSVNRRANQRYRYLESGLRNVWLEGVTVYECRRYRDRFPEIRNIERLHSLIAGAIAEKRSALTGPEFRFLRKHMRLKAKELAAVLGVTLTTISRWETGAERIGPANDRLTRCLYLFWRLKQREAFDSTQIFEHLHNQLRDLSARPRVQQITIKADMLTS